MKPTTVLDFELLQTFDGALPPKELRMEIASKFERWASQLRGTVAAEDESQPNAETMRSRYGINPGPAEAPIAQADMTRPRLICDDCGKNPALVYASKIVEGQLLKKDVCVECADKRLMKSLVNSLHP